MSGGTEAGPLRGCFEPAPDGLAGESEHLAGRLGIVGADSGERAGGAILDESHVGVACLIRLADPDPDPESIDGRFHVTPFEAGGFGAA